MDGMGTRDGEADDDESTLEKFVWTASKVIHRLGQEINDESSVLYWAAKNEIPIFCPALTDGSVGDMIYFHSYKKAGFVLDIAEDIRRLNDLAVKSHAPGMIIPGGCVAKHRAPSLCTSTRARSLMAVTAALRRTKPSVGARFESPLNL